MIPVHAEEFREHIANRLEKIALDVRHRDIGFADIFLQEVLDDIHLTFNCILDAMRKDDAIEERKK